MSYGAFLTQAILISLSGVMGPGPLTVVVVGHGAKSARSGIMISVGHGIVEFPLMALIVMGLGPFFQNAVFASVVGLAGGIVLLWMGYGLLRSLRRRTVVDVGSQRVREASPLVAGVLMTAGNPYFLVWWATVGATLVYRAWSYGIWLFVVFAVVHWSLDLIWYFFLSSAAFRGARLLGERFLKGVSLVAGVLLVFFGVRFVVDAVGRLAA
jgi:threonine/homoserine/homoserine lactone efflux protein